MEIIFVTGKGGVGKSAVAAAMAYKYSETGRKTLLIELGEKSYFDLLFGKQSVTYTPKNLKKDLDICLWSGEECLRDYIQHLVKLETIARLFFENPVTKALIKTAPALKELAVLGKITSAVRNIGPKLKYDVLIIDAYSSGHFLALLNAPIGMSQSIQYGPMSEQSKGIQKVLRDKNFCKYFVVATPNELPMMEGLELSQSIEKIIGQKPKLVINQTLKTPAEDNFENIFTKAILKQKKIEQEQIQTAKDAWVLPKIWSDKNTDVISELAKEISL